VHIGVSGFAEDTTVEEVKEALESYGAPIISVEFKESEDPARILALIDVDTNEIGCKVLAEKIDGHVWKGRKLRAQSYLLFK